MRFLANENFPQVAVEALRARGHDVAWVRTDSPGRLFTAPPSVVWSHFVLFPRLVLEQFPIHLAWLLPLGAVLIKRRRRRVVGALGIVIALNVLYAINYTIPDIEAYYLPTMLALCVFAAAGLNFILERPRKPAARALISAALPALLILALVAQFPRANKRDATYITDYAHNALKTVGRDAVLIACGDSSYNALLYAIEVEGRRQLRQGSRNRPHARSRPRRPGDCACV